jgi:hypothetical protein
MNNEKSLKIIIPLIFVLAFFAVCMGLFYTTVGQPYSFTNHRGETNTINGHGLYYYDTVSSAAQMQGNDLITLIVGLPLLAVSTWLAFRGSLRGRLLLTGTVGFFLYTYMSMATLTSYNNLFLIYTALFALSLYAFILCMLSFDPKNLPGHFSDRLPRKWISGLMFVVALFLTLAWLGRIINPMLQNKIPALENTTTLVIQFMDLSLIVPASVLGGILLLRKNAWGYLIASILLTKGITLGLGVSTMAVNMALKGVPDSLIIMVPFLLITAANLVMTVILLKNVKENDIPNANSNIS